MNSKHPRAVLFITGAFVSHQCWDEWKSYFETKGYTTLAPPWPNKDASAEVLRNRQPDALVASNRLAMLIDYFADIVKSLPGRPILIGHSIGGLIVQLLLQRGLGALGVAIHSVPPQGVFTFKWSFIKAGWGALGFFTSVKKTYLMVFSDWKYAFTNGMDCEQQKDSYYKFAIPESKLIVRDTISKVAKVDFDNPHAPLLFVSGSNDHTIPASLNYSNFKKYKNSNSVTEYQEFAGRNHFVLGQPTWKENADYILEWIGNSSDVYGCYQRQELSGQLIIRSDCLLYLHIHTASCRVQRQLQFLARSVLTYINPIAQVIPAPANTTSNKRNSSNLLCLKKTHTNHEKFISEDLASSSDPDFSSRMYKGEQSFIRNICIGSWRLAGSLGLADVKDQLEKNGQKVIVVELPAHDADTTSPFNTSIDIYRDKVISAINKISVKVVLVGHSMGGVVISAVAEKVPNNIEKLVYIGAFIPVNGQSLSDLASTDTQSHLGPALRSADGGLTLDVVPDSIVNIFCQDGSAQTKQLVLNKFKNEPGIPFQDKIKLTAGAFGTVDKYYIKTLQDHAVGPDLQSRMIATAGIAKVYSVNSGHCPFLSMPGIITDLLMGIIK